MAPLEKKQQMSLAKKILAVMAAIGSLKKDKKNDFHNYQYASDEMIVAALRDAVIEHGLAIFPSQKSCTEIMTKTAKGEDQIVTKLEMEFELMDSDSGESKVVTFFGYGSDRGDKGVYKACTGAEKYFLMKQFLIATPDDPEFEKNQRSARTAYSTPAQPLSGAPKPSAKPPAVKPPMAAPPISPPASSPAPAASTSAPTNGKVPQKTIEAFVQDVALVTPKNGGAKFYKLNGTEGESWITFSETIAKNAKEFAQQGVFLSLTLDMHTRGPVVSGVKAA